MQVQTIDMSVPVGGAATQDEVEFEKVESHSPQQALVNECIKLLGRRRRLAFTRRTKHRRASDFERDIKVLAKKYAATLGSELIDKSQLKRLRVQLFADLVTLAQHVTADADRRHNASRRRWRVAMASLFAALIVSNGAWAYLLLTTP